MAIVSPRPNEKEKNMEVFVVILFVVYATIILWCPISTKVTIRLARLVTITSAVLLFLLAKHEEITQIAYVAMAIGHLLICLFTPLILEKITD